MRENQYSSGVDTGRKLRVLTIVDTFTRFAPAIVPAFSFRAADVVAVLDRACGENGFPRTIRVDQGAEFVSCDLDLWAYTRGVALDSSRPGKPTDNAFIESLNGRFRTECLNLHWFMGLADAQEKMEDWRKDYNERRPHSAIGQRCPIELHRPQSAGESPCLKAGRSRPAPWSNVGVHSTPGAHSTPE